MKQALQLRLGQHLTMTPQLQQAIRLLQLSTLELQTEIQEALDSNLMLEVDEESNDADSISNNEASSSPAEENLASDDSGESLSETSAAGESEIPEDLPVDTSWDDIYDNISAPTSPGSSSASENREFEYSGNTEESLHEHLRWQMQLTPFSDTDRAIAEFIIDAINDDGYLSMSLEDIHQALLGDLEIDEDEIEAVLHRIQNFDPPGVGARDLQENLLLQLKQFPLESPWLQPAQQLIENHFDLLANREYAQLTRRLKVSEEELKLILQLIQSLNPRPVSYTHLTLPTNTNACRSRWSPYH